MIETIMATLTIVGWLGVVLGILAFINIVTGTLVNVWSKNEPFSIKRMGKGIFKVIVFYISAVALSIAFTMLPFINDMITNTFEVVLLSDELLNTLSSVGVLSVVCSTIVVQAKKAIQGILTLGKISSGSSEEITWEVKDE